MDAQQLFREGVIAIREHQDYTRARQLLKQSLELEPRNIQAWLWLTRTVNDPSQKLAFVQRALQIDANHSEARKLYQRLNGQVAQPPSVSNPSHSSSQLQPSPESTPGIAGFREMIAATRIDAAPQTTKSELSLAEKHQVQQHLGQADLAIQAGNLPDAIAQWLEVLSIQVDHPEAIKKAAINLWNRGYEDEARAILQNAFDAKTTSPVVYQTAIQLAEDADNPREATRLRLRLARLPDTDQATIDYLVAHFLQLKQPKYAMRVLEYARQASPDNQRYLIRLGDLKQEFGSQDEAISLYEQAAQTSRRSQLRRAAEERLHDFVPTLSDRERTSVLLALREVIGISIIYLALAFQDVGLDFGNMNPVHWAGIGLAVIGSYLFVTATSSPQQLPLARWLGGNVPEDQDTHVPILSVETRVMMGILGISLLIAAFIFVFGNALELLIDPVRPDDLYEIFELDDPQAESLR
ncbi:MAG: hypothetical protein GYB66_12820 [Chloroflexi bacterium]|nr:hypothetical protein [Chloroflexota bacterium]